MAPSPTSKVLLLSCMGFAPLVEVIWKDEIDEQEEDGRSSDLEIGTNGSHRTSQILIALRYHLKILISLCRQFSLCRILLSVLEDKVQADVAGACTCGILRKTVTPDLFTRLSNNNISSRYVILRCAAHQIVSSSSYRSLDS
ncbi:hypothetical protein C5167_018455 [Papaver somniferum]|uniref:Uncharacterized protein n=1 Tax=Papaver somniferum TaxID=3469 RepID=A0A4Y7IPI7_PAPSO|nr:hypothetical protein C5167_018455 [Papaver somniferum]